MLIIFAVVVGAIVLSHTAPFPFLLEGFRPGRSMWHVERAAGLRPAVYLTFDDGPNPDWTPAVLDALRDERAAATFFLIDDHITPETAPIVRRIAEEGHAIGLHSGSRKPVIASPDRLVERLSAAAARIGAIAGRPPCPLFRPHAGWRSATMYDALDRMNYRLAGWSWGMWDWNWWQARTAANVAARLQRKASSGDIIVIHDGHHKNPRADRRHAAGTVRLLVPALRARGFDFLPLCESR